MLGLLIDIASRCVDVAEVPRCLLLGVFITRCKAPNPNLLGVFIERGREEGGRRVYNKTL